MIDLNEIKQLVEMDSQAILSLYLRVDPALDENQAPTPAWRIWLKNALRDLDKTVPADQQTQWITLRDQAVQFLSSYGNHTKGLVLFFGEGIAKTYELPIRPEQNDAKFGEPLIAPLLWILDEYERYLIVLVDKEEAHFLSTYLGTIEREEAMASDRFSFDFREKTLMPRPTGTDAGGGQITGGSHRDAFADKMDAFIAKFHHDVADRIDRLMGQIGADRVIIGGSEQSAQAIARSIHDTTRQHLAGVAAIPFELGDAEVMNRVIPVALNYERQKEIEIVNRVIDWAKSGGRAVLGSEDVQKALNEQRVELIVAPWPPEDTAKLDAMTVAALRNNSPVELVGGEAAERLRENGQIAAQLYFVS